MHRPALQFDHLDEKQFLLTVTQLAESLSFGSEVSAFLGSGVDYAQSRIYQPGDPVKSIDWRASARTGRIFVREFETLRQMPLHLIIDASGSMQVASRQVSKYGWSVVIAGALALAALNQNIPVAMRSTGQAFDGNDLQFEPSLSRQRVHQWMHLLRNGARFTQRPDSLGEALRQLGIHLPHRSLILLLSDLHEPGSLRALRQLAHRHDVIVLKMVDPVETHPLGGGIFRGAEAETNRTFLVNGKKTPSADTPSLQELRRAGIDILPIAIDDAFLPGLRAFLKQRPSARRGA